jgi:ArsR family transcriptional regulator
MQPVEFFAALANETRLRCMILLSRHTELCVCELTHALDTRQPLISRHLAHLRASGFVVDRRQGLWVFYSINPALPAWAKAGLRDTAQGIAESPPFSEDHLALLTMQNRPDRACCA